MSTFVYGYKAGSKSAKELALGLGAKRIKHKGSKFKGTANKTVINWGSSEPKVDFGDAKVINKPYNIGLASNKLKAFKELQAGEVSIPPYTQKREQAEEWIREGHKVFCRTKLTGNSGDGIVVSETLDELVNAPLYTKWLRIGTEYRVHVFRGEIVDYQRKARKKEVPDDKVNWKVRNLKGGFIFMRGGVELPKDIKEQSIISVAALGLDFGAVDIIVGKRDNKPYVLEVNTACGLMGTTLDNYVKVLGEL